MTISDEEISRLQALSEDNLRVEIGRAILKDRGGLQARPPSIQKLIAEANAWITEKNGELQDAICSSERVRAVAGSSAGAREKLVRVVADVVTAIVVFVPVGTVAEILVRDGIPEYCKSRWNQRP